MITYESHIEEEKPLYVHYLRPALYLNLRVPLRQFNGLSRHILQHLAHSVAICNHLHSRLMINNLVDELDIEKVRCYTKCLDGVFD